MNRLTLSLVLAACLVALTLTAQETSAPSSEYRMAWVLTYNEHIGTTETIRQTVAEAREAGLNTLLPVAHRRGRAYYNSTFLPVYNPTGTPAPLDTIREFIQAAYDTTGGGARIEIHPWIVLFPVWMEETAPPEGHIILKHPEWLTSPWPSGDVKPDVQKWLDPGVPGVCDYIVDVCREIVSRYDVDGLNLDYIRYREGGHGYNAIALERFQKETGRADIPHPEDKEWMTWRRAQVTNLLRRIRKETRAIRPNLKISVCSIVWGTPSDDMEQSRALMSVMQDWPAWCAEGLVDINIPMNYHDDEKENRRASFREWNRILRKKTGDRLLVVGQGNYMNTIEGSLAQIRSTREAGADGYCLFRFAANNNQDIPYKKLLQALRREINIIGALPPALPAGK